VREKLKKQSMGYRLQMEEINSDGGGISMMKSFF